MIIKQIKDVEVADGTPLDFSRGPMEMEVVVKINETGETRSAGIVSGTTWEELERKASQLGRMMAEEMTYRDECQCDACSVRRKIRAN